MSKKPTQPASPEKNIENLPAESAASGVQRDMRVQVERAVGALISAPQRDLIVERLTSLVVRENFKGPIAHPKHLEEYERICPGAAERIIAMAEREQNSNHDLVRADIQLAQSAQRDDTADKKRGMYLGFAAFGLMMLCALIALHWKEPWMAGAFLATSVASAVGIFVQGRSKQKNDTSDDEIRLP